MFEELANDGIQLKEDPNAMEHLRGFTPPQTPVHDVS